MEELYYVKVETHHNNIKGKWIAEEAKAQFNNTVINADDYPELLSALQGTVYAGGQELSALHVRQNRRVQGSNRQQRHPVHKLLRSQVC